MMATTVGSTAADVLPPEIWTHIVDALPAHALQPCALVSREWNAIAGGLMESRYRAGLTLEALSLRSLDATDKVKGRKDHMVPVLRDVERRAAEPFLPSHLAREGHLDLLRWTFLHLVRREQDKAPEPRRPPAEKPGRGHCTSDHDLPPFRRRRKKASRREREGGPADALGWRGGPESPAEGGVESSIFEDVTRMRRKVGAPLFARAAAEGGHLDCLEWLIGEGLPAGDALAAAARCGKSDAVEWLAERGHVLDRDGRRIDAVGASLEGGHSDLAARCFRDGLFGWSKGLDDLWADAASRSADVPSAMWLVKSLLVWPLHCLRSPSVDYVERMLAVSVGADTPADAARGRERPAEGGFRSDEGSADEFWSTDFSLSEALTFVKRRDEALSRVSRLSDSSRFPSAPSPCADWRSLLRSSASPSFACDGRGGGGYSISDYVESDSGNESDGMWYDMRHGRPTTRLSRLNPFDYALVEALWGGHDAVAVRIFGEHGGRMSGGKMDPTTLSEIATRCASRGHNRSLSFLLENADALLMDADGGDESAPRCGTEGLHSRRLPQAPSPPRPRTKPHRAAGRDTWMAPVIAQCLVSNNPVGYWALMARTDAHLDVSRASRATKDLVEAKSHVRRVILNKVRKLIKKADEAGDRAAYFLIGSCWASALEGRYGWMRSVIETPVARGSLEARRGGRSRGGRRGEVWRSCTEACGDGQPDGMAVDGGGHASDPGSGPPSPGSRRCTSPLRPCSSFDPDPQSPRLCPFSTSSSSSLFSTPTSSSSSSPSSSCPSSPGRIVLQASLSDDAHDREACAYPPDRLGEAGSAERTEELAALSCRAKAMLDALSRMEEGTEAYDGGGLRNVRGVKGRVADGSSGDEDGDEEREAEDGTDEDKRCGRHRTGGGSDPGTADPPRGFTSATASSPCREERSLDELVRPRRRRSRSERDRTKVERRRKGRSGKVAGDVTAASGWADMPKKLCDVVGDRLGRKDAFALPFVCKNWRRSFGARGSCYIEDRPTPHHVGFHLSEGNVALALWAHDTFSPGRRSPTPETLRSSSKWFAKAATQGRVDVLAALRERGYPFPDGTLATAIESDRMDVLKFCLAEGCRIDLSACVRAAAMAGGTRYLEELHRHLGPLAARSCLMDPDVSVAAIESDLIDAFKWLRARGARWDWRVCDRLAMSGDLETLRWAIESEGGIVSASALVSAASTFGIHTSGRMVEEDFVLRIMELVDIHISPPEDRNAKDAEALEAAIRRGRRGVAEWLIARSPGKMIGGAEGSERFCVAGARAGCVRMLHWLRDGCGFLWDARVTAMAAACGNYMAFDYAMSRGCPWDTTVYDEIVTGRRGRAREAASLASRKGDKHRRVPRNNGDAWWQ